MSPRDIRREESARQAVGSRSQQITGNRRSELAETELAETEAGVDRRSALLEYLVQKQEKSKARPWS